MGYTLQKLGRYDEAIQNLLKAIEIDPQFKLPHFNMGYVFYELGLYQQSLQSYERAIEIDP